MSALLGAYVALSIFIGAFSAIASAFLLVAWAIRRRG